MLLISRLEKLGVQADMWRQEVQQHDVLVLTYQILLNTLSAGFIQVYLSRLAHCALAGLTHMLIIKCHAPAEPNCAQQHPASCCEHMHRLHARNLHHATVRACVMMMARCGLPPPAA